MTVRSLVLATLMVVAPVTASAQSWAIQGIDRYFRVESSVTQGRRGPMVTGYVYNTYGHTAGNVRLIVEELDGGGQVTSTTITQVVGTVPPGDRAYFEARVPDAGTQYRVRVGSYDPVGRGQ